MPDSVRMRLRALALLFAVLPLAPLPAVAESSDMFTLVLPAEISALMAERDRLMAEGDWAAALPLQERIVKAAIAEGGELHLKALSEQVMDIRFRDNLGQHDEALAMAEALWAKVTARYGAFAMHRVEPGLLVADLLSKSGARSRALPIAMDIARMTEAVMGEGNAATAYTRFQAVLILERMGYRDQAVDAYAELIPVLLADPSPGAQGLAGGVAVRRGKLLDRRGDLDAALAEYQRADDIFSRVKGERHPETLAGRRLLGRLLFDLGRNDEVKAILDRNLPVVAEVYGADGVETADWKRLAARWTQAAGAGPEAAVPMMAEALEILRRRLPRDHALLTEAEYDFAGLLTYVQDWQGAWTHYIASEAGGVTDRKFALDLLSYMLDAKQIDEAQMAELALPTLQRAAFGPARGAVDEQTKRQLLTSGEARDLYRQASDQGERRSAVQAELSDLAMRPKAEGDAARERALRQELDSLTEGIAGLMAEVARLEPGFAALTGDRVLTVKEVQATLGPDEVFVIIDHQRHDEEWSVALAVTKEKAVARLFWLRTEELKGWVQTIRDSVALKLGTRTATALDGEAGPASDFPFDAAWQLYYNSFNLVWDLIDEKPHLLVDLRGPLTGLPPHLLLRYEPAADEQLETAPFVLRYQAVTVLPSVAALGTARAAGAAPDRPFIGFADPVFDPAAMPELLADASTEGQNRLRGALAPLPETAAELTEVAGFVGADQAERLTGAAASETAVKAADLSRYGMVYFATHGLVGGDRLGTTLLSEAALALTPGGGEDGFLTATEIARLRLNADWVVLSACNTAQGDTPGAEALSGLAQAFLYAGARAMLVSHWPVESRSAAHLMTETFRLRAETPGLSAVEAQRQAMVAMVTGDAGARWKHPAYWAPFVVIGSPAE